MERFYHSVFPTNLDHKIVLPAIVDIFCIGSRVEHFKKISFFSGPVVAHVILYYENER